MSSTKWLAYITSIVFDPRVEIPVMLVLAVRWAYHNSAPGEFLILLLLVDSGLPLAFYWHLLKKREISDWDITKRQERVPLYWFTVLAHGVGVGMALVFGQLALAETLGAFWLLAVIFSLATSMFKVSVHVGVNAALATYVTMKWGWAGVWLYGLVAAVAWSRRILHRHEWWQIGGGLVLGAGGMAAGLKLMGI